LAPSAAAPRLGADLAGGHQAGPSDERGPEGREAARRERRSSTRADLDAEQASLGSCQPRRKISMSDIGNNAQAELKRRAQRRVDLLDQVAELQEELKLFKAQDKEDGFTEKALAQVIKEMRRGVDYQAAQLQLELEVDTYRRACGLPVTLEDAQKLAAAEAAEVPDTPEEKSRAKRNTRKDLS
jgi:hypothetical protein